jgi:hypothetical protein
MGANAPMSQSEYPTGTHESIISHSTYFNLQNFWHTYAARKSLDNLVSSHNFELGEILLKFYNTPKHNFVGPDTE